MSKKKKEVSDTIIITRELIKKIVKRDINILLFLILVAICCLPWFWTSLGFFFDSLGDYLFVTMIEFGFVCAIIVFIRSFYTNDDEELIFFYVKLLKYLGIGNILSVLFAIWWLKNGIYMFFAGYFIGFFFSVICFDLNFYFNKIKDEMIKKK